ncbi:hypothetical protein AHAS_Ahas14G0095700 [Arachis hypogaea]
MIPGRKRTLPRRKRPTSSSLPQIQLNLQTDTVSSSIECLINPYFMMYLVLNLSDLFNPSPTYSCKLHGFTFPPLFYDICEKNVSYALKILILITLYYHSMP